MRGGVVARTAARWPVALVVALGVLLHAPALGWGFFGDDFALVLRLERPGQGVAQRASSLFDFGGTPRQPGDEADSIRLPWWVAQDWRVRFFRPLTGLTHAMDHALWGRNAALHHATSLALHAVLLILLHGLYRAAGLTRSVALWALGVFALEDGSILPVAWIANRNTLIEALFSVSAVLVLLRGLPSPSRSRIAASLALAGLACLGKESGVVTFAALAILLGVEARRRGDSAAQRRAVFGALGAVAAALGYVGFLMAAGYGTSSLFYLMPWSQPLEFARRALLMIALSAQGALGPFSIDVPLYFPALLVPWIAIGLLLGWPVAGAVLRSERCLPRAAFFATWGLLALLPQAGTLPSDRLLFVPMIGFAPWIGAFARRAIEPAPWRRRGLPVLIAICALPWSGLLLLGRTAWFARITEVVRAATLSAEVPRDGTRCDAIVLQSGSTLSMLAADPAWIFLTSADAVRFHPVQAGRRALRLTTVDERTFDVESLEGPLLDTPFEEVFLSREDSFHPKEIRRGRGFRVEIRSLDRDRPRAIRITLDEPIASPRWRFLIWREGAFRGIDLPRAGGSLVLNRCEVLAPLLP